MEGGRLGKKKKMDKKRGMTSGKRKSPPGKEKEMREGEALKPPVHS